MVEIAERYDEQFRSQLPLNANDPARFGEPREAVADLMVSYLTSVLTRDATLAGQLTEMPGIEKWLRWPIASHNTQPVMVYRWSDKAERLPRVVVSVSRAAELPYLSHKVAAGWLAPTIATATAGPWALASGDQLVLRYRGAREVGAAARRGGRTNHLDYGYQEVTVTYHSTDAADTDAVTPAELAALICRQAQPDIGATYSADGLVVIADGPGPGWLEVAGGAIATALGWGRGGALVSLAGAGAPITATLDAGANTSGGDVGRYLTLSGMRRDRNDGRWLIEAAPTPTTLTVSRRYGIAETPDDATWWIGEYATTEGVAPRIRRAMLSSIDVEVKVMTGSANETLGLSDAVYDALTILADRNRQALMGLGLDPNIGEGLRPASPNQRGMFTLTMPVSVAADNKMPRLNDPSEGVHEAVVMVQGTYHDYVDRTARLLTSYQRVQ